MRIKTPNPSSKKRNLRKKPDISKSHHWFPREISFEERAQKFHADLRVSLLVIRRAEREICFKQSKAVARFGY